MSDPMRSLSARIDRAIYALDDARKQADRGSERAKRLAAKIEGVALVGSYVDEYLRADQPTEGGDQ